MAPAPPRSRVLVVDDDESVGRALSLTLRQEGHAAEVVTGGEAALSRLEDAPFDVVVTDLRMPGMDGLALLREVQARGLDVPVVVVTAHGSVPVAVEAMRAGAADFLTKPFERAEIAFVVDKLLVRRTAPSEAPQRAPPAAADPFEAMLVGRSEAIAATRALLARAARSDATVLLRGESGTGKDVAARALHAGSARGPGPFVKVHCGALPDTLLESELFGHEKGAFTGAVSRKPGRVELALGGTLFLDEIGDVTPAFQVKLLELLQDRAFHRVGGTSRVAADVRFVAATHRDLEAMVAAGTFREDLYYRLVVVPVTMPALRDRPEDVVPLARELVARLGPGAGRPGATLTAAALARLEEAAWPGNVRQLANTLERLIVLADADEISREAVERELARTPAIRAAEPSGGGATRGDLEAQRAAAERAAIGEALGRAKGNKALAARLLGVSRRTLYNKLEALSLDPG